MQGGFNFHPWDIVFLLLYLLYFLGIEIENFQTRSQKKVGVQVWKIWTKYLARYLDFIKTESVESEIVPEH